MDESERKEVAGLAMKEGSAFIKAGSYEQALEAFSRAAFLFEESGERMLESEALYTAASRICGRPSRLKKCLSWKKAITQFAGNGTYGLFGVIPRRLFAGLR